MADVLDIAVVFLGLLPLGLGFLCLYRLVNPYARGRRGALRELVGALAWFLVFGLLVALLIPATGAAPQAARRSQCVTNLKEILLAMQKYHEQYGCFPPAYTIDTAGRPLHSWRVLLLPFLGHKDVYDRLRMDEAFDSPHNRAVFQAAAFPYYDRTGPMPAVFWCPSDRKNRTETNYAMIVGPQTISAGANSVRQKDITDGLANTICVVETAGTGIRWYEPRDLEFDRMSFRINDPEYYCISSQHRGGANIATCEGAVWFLRDNLDCESVRALTTINGGDKLPDW